ncbi:hypothetical protein MIZ01_1059 [Sideroxyarcus emersonii]|uniref:Uncharacterized protein n=1 Tax=Sideroxyarcus emersonii TaxID=2764705 RepID=A0AAN1X9Y9_9PROT|nr:hypothetical protein MIZ01_1059 [Sideroxyarcus emersonii]
MNHCRSKHNSDAAHQLDSGNFIDTTRATHIKFVALQIRHTRIALHA